MVLANYVDVYPIFSSWAQYDKTILIVLRVRFSSSEGHGTIYPMPRLQLTNQKMLAEILNKRVRRSPWRSSTNSLI